jgi:hypothetical protein
MCFQNDGGYSCSAVVANESNAFTKMKARRPTVDRSYEDDAFCDRFRLKRGMVLETLHGEFLEWKRVTSYIKTALEYLDDTQSRVLIVYTTSC